MTAQPDAVPAGALAGVRVLDLTRILAGPTCTQLLADLGADVIKIENPGKGDDTRGWGPPFVPDKDGHDSDLSAYFMCANRNKRSVTADLASEDGRALIEALLARSDVLVENFRPGGLKRFGLAHDDLAGRYPGLVYCSISGFGQTGPRRKEAGYDFLAQAMGGLMSLTGAPEGEPVKVGVGLTDLMCGMYATVAILAALHHRRNTGEGQHIDLSLFDTQLACLANEGTNFLLSGQVPQRRGNEHPNIVPYKSFLAADKHVVLNVGNDGQFREWCEAAEVSELADDPRFATNAARVRNRAALHAIMEPIFAGRSADDWVKAMHDRGVPCGPVNSVKDALADPQAVFREMVISQERSDIGDASVSLIANPIKMSRTPVRYRRPPPRLGEHTDEVRWESLAGAETTPGSGRS